MDKCRLLGAGLLLWVAGGCATPKKPISISSNQAKSPATQPLEEPKWEASSTPAELLAQKTAAYANALRSTDSTDQGIAPQPDASAALLGGAHKHHRHFDSNDTAPPITSVPADGHAPPPAPPPLVMPAATVANVSSAGDPKIMPESADFASMDSVSKDSLGTRLRKRTRDNPHDLADQLDLQLYGMLNDDPSPELASVSELPDDDRELVSALIDGISNFRSAVREDSNMLQAKKIQPLLEMADRLRAQADLTVSNIALCRRVDGFGKYEPISPLRFPAMQENAAIVYCEVENFVPRQEGAMWKTRLTEQVTLYSDMGVLAWSDDQREVNDECRDRRHDFFAYNIIRLPSTLTVGRYVLKVSVEDKNADHVAEATVPLEIVAE